MTMVSLSPVFNGTQFFDNNGSPLNGGLLYQYIAGSTTQQQTTYSNQGGSIANANPIVLDSSGRIPVQLWLVNGEYYNLVVTDSNGTILISNDNVGYSTIAGVTQIIAGENISIDPSGGTGIVTISYVSS